MKLRSKFLMALLLVVSLAIVSVGCKKADTTTESPEATKAPEAGQTAETTKPEKLVELTMIRMGTEPQGMDEFYKQLDALTIPDLNCTVRFQWIAWGEEGTKIPLSITDGTVDILCGGPWSKWSEYATKNGFADLTDLLSTVPDLVELYNTNMGPNHIESTKIDGKLYGFTQLSDGVGGDGFFWREDLRKAWGLKEITGIETIEEYLYAAKDNGYQPAISDDRVLDFLWQMVGAGTYYEVPGTNKDYVATYADPMTPILKYSTSEYKQCVEIAAKWYQDGIINSSVLSGRQGEAQVLMAQDAVAAEFCNHFWVYDGTFIPAILEAIPTAEFGYINYNMIGGAPMFRPSSNTTTISISSQSENIETALKFIEKGYTDQTYSRLLKYGVERLHYNVVDGALDKTGIAAEFNNPTVTGFGNFTTDYNKKWATEQWMTAGTKEIQRQKTGMAELDQYNPFEGFSFNVDEVKTEYASFTNIISQYEIPLSCGVINESIDADLSNLLAQLEKAGEPVIRQALTNQIAASQN